jgi:hypothetical protein
MTIDYADQLRRVLAVSATQYAQDHRIPYYCSTGAPPTLLFHPYGPNDAHHGNFHHQSYPQILTTERLAKPHPHCGALPPDRQEIAKELDSSTSSAALLMNIFCHPDAQTHAPLATLFGLSAPLTPHFGVQAGPQSEVDMTLGPVHVAATLTERSFTIDPQAIAADPSKRFILLIDARRPDLVQAFALITAAIRDTAIQQRCQLLTWQQVAYMLPVDLREFLGEKYGIEPIPFGPIARSHGSMDLTAANEALGRTYRDRIGALIDALGAVAGVSNPHLITAPPEYAKADVRLMVIGQQTFGYVGQLGQDLGADPVGRLMDVYTDFRLGEHYRTSPFWAAAHQVYAHLNPKGPPAGFIWSNLIKVDQYGNRPDPAVEEECCDLFGVLTDEIALLQPDVVLFFTGPQYDQRLLTTFAGAKLLEVGTHPLRELARVEHPWLPAWTFRTYHPAYLRRRGLWHLLDEIGAIGESDSRADGASNGSQGFA